MKRSLFAVAAMMMVASAAHAQRPFQVGVAGGVSLPTSSLNDAADLGFNLAASVGFKPAMLPFGVRVEGAWDQFNFDKNVTSVDGHFRSLSLTGNGVVELPSSSPVKLYGIAGLGLYSINASASVSGGTYSTSSQSKFGWNAGAGVRMPLSGFDTFLEARYHYVTNTNGFRFVPITFGVRF